MSLQSVATMWRPKFALRRPVVFRWGHLGDKYGQFFMGKRSHTVIIDPVLCAVHDDLIGTVLHEYIHAEQADAGLPLDHGAYFQARRKELVALTGYPV